MEKHYVSVMAPRASSAERIAMAMAMALRMQLLGGKTVARAGKGGGRAIPPPRL